MTADLDTLAGELYAPVVELLPAGQGERGSGTGVASDSRPPGNPLAAGFACNGEQQGLVKAPPQRLPRVAVDAFLEPGVI